MFNFDRFMFALQYMWKGMLCIFVVIAVIIGVIWLMNAVNTKLARYQALLRSDEQAPRQ